MKALKILGGLLGISVLYDLVEGLFIRMYWKHKGCVTDTCGWVVNTDGKEVPTPNRVVDTLTKGRQKRETAGRKLGMKIGLALTKLSEETRD